MRFQLPLPRGGTKLRRLVELFNERVCLSLSTARLFELFIAFPFSVGFAKRRSSSSAVAFCINSCFSLGIFTYIHFPFQCTFHTGANAFNKFSSARCSTNLLHSLEGYLFGFSGILVAPASFSLCFHPFSLSMPTLIRSEIEHVGISSFLMIFLRPIRTSKYVHITRVDLK